MAATIAVWAWDDIDVTVFDQLLALQDLDLRIHQLNHRRVNLPEFGALEANAAERAVVVASRAEVAAAHKELVRRQHVLEDEISLVTDRATGHETNLYSGSVSNPRELQALQEDIDSLRRRQRTLEDQDLELMEEIEPLTAQMAESDAASHDLEAHAAELKVALDAATADIDAELAETTAQRAAGAAAIDDAVVTDYEQLRVQLGGIAIARLVGNACGGCHLSLSAVELDRIRRLDPDTRVVCDECGRILVR